MGPMASAAAASAAVGLERLAPGVPAPLRGFEYPAPRHPSYLRQERTDDVDELMPLARSHVRRRYGRSALGNISADDELLIITYPHQHDAVFEALRRALLEEGVKRVDRLDMTDLGMDVEEFSAADGWREISGRLAAMVEEGVEYKASAAALKRFLEDRPGYTGVFAGESGRRHWKRAAASGCATTGATPPMRTSSRAPTATPTRSGARSTLAPDLIGVAVGARDEVLIGGVAQVVAHPLARHPLPVRAAGLAGEHAGVAGAVLKEALQRGGRRADLPPAVGGGELLDLHAQVGHVQPVDALDALLQQRPLDCLEHGVVLVGVGDDQQLVVGLQVAQGRAAVAPAGVRARQRHQLVDVVGALLPQIARMARSRVVEAGQRVGNPRRQVLETDLRHVVLLLVAVAGTRAGTRPGCLWADNRLLPAAPSNLRLTLRAPSLRAARARPLSCGRALATAR